MDRFSHNRDLPPALQSITFAPPNEPLPDGTHFQSDSVALQDKADSGAIAFMKGPKRKRLAKACDACHKSKRRCDGTAPCSNCYFASKKCSYTDASGRPVPAPRLFKLDRSDTGPEIRQAPYPPYPDSYQNTQQLPGIGDGLLPRSDIDEDVGGVRKKFRPGVEKDLSHNATLPAVPTVDRSRELDPLLTRELVNLFFAHRHSQIMMFHKAKFYAALSHGRVPSYLLLSICAVAAPLSRRLTARVAQPRLVGDQFAQEAVSILFDGNAHLKCEPCLEAAQALVLLQFHERSAKSAWNATYYEVAIDALEKLGIFKTSGTPVTPAPSAEYIDAAITQECLRRVFWHIHISDLMASVLYKRPIKASDSQLQLRLPVDETSFELSVHATVPEYVGGPSPLSPYASETGHVIRVLSLWSKIERAMDEFHTPNSGSEPVAILLDLENSLTHWAGRLPDHLRYTDDNLQTQMSMFETGSSLGAWCFCFMHVIHATAAIGLNQARQRCRTAEPGGPQWAHGKLTSIVTALGSRARNTQLLGIACWSLFKYCYGEHPHVRAWAAEFEQYWGIRIQDLCTPAPDYRLLPPVHHPPHHAAVYARPASPPTFKVPVSSAPPPGMDSASTAKPTFGRTNEDMRVSSLSSSDRKPAGAGIAETRDKELRKLINDSDIDPVLQTSTGARVPSIVECLPSLPSLKASGLLDSWNTPSASDPVHPATGGWVSSSQQRAPLRQSHREVPQSPAMTSPYSNASSPRNTSSSAGMPVGLPWLASESSVNRFS